MLIASNHQSFLDPLLVGIRFPYKISFMARKSLFKGFHGWILRKWHVFPVKRGEADPEAMKEAIRKLRSGSSVIVFPEGTRTRDGWLGKIKEGVPMLAARADVPILPVYVDGAYDIWPKGRKFPRPWGKISVYFGKPFRIEEVSKATRKKDRYGDAAEHLSKVLHDFERQAKGERPESSKKADEPGKNE